MDPLHMPNLPPIPFYSRTKMHMQTTTLRLSSPSNPLETHGYRRRSRFSLAIFLCIWICAPLKAWRTCCAGGDDGASRAILTFTQHTPPDVLMSCNGRRAKAGILQSIVCVRGTLRAYRVYRYQKRSFVPVILHATPRPSGLC